MAVDAGHPVQLLVHDDLRRSRLTVFFRLLLAIPHFFWFVIWSLLVVVVVVLGWFATLASGRLPIGMHTFLRSYVRYATHLYAYVGLVANPYPGFGGNDAYDVDVALPELPERQSRLRTFFRLPLALPALILGTALAGGGGWAIGGGTRGNRSSGYLGTSGLLTVVSVLGWFASLARGRMPPGLRDAGAYTLGYRAQGYAYVLLLTDRYPDSDPTALLATVARPPLHPVRLVGDAEDRRRSRLTVFFRLPLAFPHIVWLLLWSVVAWLAAIVQWLVMLVRGRPVAALHRFLARFVRYSFHVYAFLLLAANPFPGFVGEEGRYPLDLELPAPARQRRWTVLLRLLLAIPAFVVAGALDGVLLLCAFFTWFYALARGAAPYGLRNLSAYALRYAAQTNAYTLLVTGTYPHASPLEGAAAADVEP